MLKIYSHQNRIRYFFVGSVKVIDGVPRYPESVKLVPGPNIIKDQRIIDGLMKDSAFLEAIECTKEQRRLGRPLKGVDVEMLPDAGEDDKKEAELTGSAVNIYAKVPVKKMVEIVSEITLVTELEDILKVESRPGVVNAVNERLSELRADLAKDSDTN